MLQPRINNPAHYFRKRFIFLPSTKQSWSQIMLVLSRRVNEEIFIGDTARIIILGVQGSRIRLGVSAPPHISIQRSEVRDRMATDRPVSRMAHLATDSGKQTVMI
tara:strand:+ start:2063 stop:2377 length:315 start_codon:yes stop_codon:yes gene_type:complete